MCVRMRPERALQSYTTKTDVHAKLVWCWASIADYCEAVSHRVINTELSIHLVLAKVGPYCNTMPAVGKCILFAGIGVVFSAISLKTDVHWLSVWSWASISGGDSTSSQHLINVSRVYGEAAVVSVTDCGPTTSQKLVNVSFLQSRVLV